MTADFVFLKPDTAVSVLPFVIFLFRFFSSVVCNDVCKGAVPGDKH